MPYSKRVLLSGLSSNGNHFFNFHLKKFKIKNKKIIKKEYSIAKNSDAVRYINVIHVL